MSFDVVVIGGGAAGLSGATALGRSRRSVVVVDAGSPRNAPAAGVHNFLSRDGLPPRELLAIGRTEVKRYGGLTLDATAVSVRRAPGPAGRIGFEVELDDGQVLAARRLLVTTGQVDQLPAIPGLAARWGRDVIHCPYCHGWEVRDQPIGVIATSEHAVHQALLFRQLSKDVVVLGHTAGVAPEQAAKLAAWDIPIIDGTVASVEVTDDRLVGVRLAAGTTVPRSALVVTTRLALDAALLAGVGLTPEPHPSGLGDVIPTIDPTGRTAEPGIWAAGNVTDPAAQVITAAAAGLMAGARLNADLIEEDTPLG
jgi:thioredoxin reductase